MIIAINSQAKVLNNICLSHTDFEAISGNLCYKHYSGWESGMEGSNWKMVDLLMLIEAIDVTYKFP